MTQFDPRPCDYCAKMFQPTRGQDKNRKFCSNEHRKLFYRHGKVPFPVIVEAVMQEIRKSLRDEIRLTIESIESNVRTNGRAEAAGSVGAQGGDAAVPALPHPPV